MFSIYLLGNLFVGVVKFFRFCVIERWGEKIIFNRINRN